MPFFSKPTFRCPPEQWTQIAATDASGMPRTYVFDFEGDDIEGEFRVRKSLLPFGIGLSESQTGQLRPRMSFEQGWFDVSYRIEVKPKSNIVAKPG